MTTSIITSESGSTSSSKPTLKLPAVSQVHAVVSSDRSSGLRPRASTNAITAPANPTKTEAVESTPAWLRVIRVPARRIAKNPASGASRQSHPPKTIRDT